MYERFKWEKDDTLVFVTNNELTCKDCVFKTEQVGACMVYENWKPNDVIQGEDCEFKKTINDFE